MSGFNWRSLAPLGIGLAGLALFYLIPTLAQHYQNASSAKYAATQEYEISKRIAPLAPTAESPPAEHIAYRDEWRSERDLRAQQDMSFWAAAMVVATLVGLSLLTFTLLETKRAAQAAFEMVDQAKKATKAAEDNVAETRRVGEAQVRAYPTVSDVTVQIDDCPTVAFLIHNSGNSPAFKLMANVRAQIQIIGTDKVVGDKRSSVGTMAGVLRQGQEIPQSIHVGTTIVTPEFRESMKGKRIEIRAYIDLAYKDVFKKRLHETFEFLVTATDPKPTEVGPMAPAFDFLDWREDQRD